MRISQLLPKTIFQMNPGPNIRSGKPISNRSTRAAHAALLLKLRTSLDVGSSDGRNSFPAPTRLLRCDPDFFLVFIVAMHFNQKIPLNVMETKIKHFICVHLYCVTVECVHLYCDFYCVHCTLVLCILFTLRL